MSFRAPTSYQGPTRKPKKEKSQTMVSQSAQTNVASGQVATVSKILEQKGNSVVTIHPSDTLKDAVVLLAEKRIGALVVTDKNDKLVGILSERDIVRKLAATPGQTLPQSVEENMTKKVMPCAPGDSLVSVLHTMTKGRFRHMPVLENEKLVGIVTIGDVVHYRLDELEYEALQLKQMVVG
ncbi:MAG: CBS domain-containing protein [Pseudomonadota bacterium]